MCLLFTGWALISSLICLHKMLFVTLFKYVSRVTERNLLGNPHIVGSLNLLTCII